MNNKICLVDSVNDHWKIIGIVDNTSFLINYHQYLNTTDDVIKLLENLLQAGVEVTVAKTNVKNGLFSINDLNYNQLSSLDLEKNKALLTISKQIDENVAKMSILNAFDFLICYMKLLNAGVFITDKNREDKYFEIIDAAQSIEQPNKPDDNATFEEEYEYIQKKKQYDEAQDNLATLEKYLNAYDKLSKINFINNLLNEIKDDVKSAETIEDINLAVEKNKNVLDQYFYTKQLISTNTDL